MAATNVETGTPAGVAAAWIDGYRSRQTRVTYRHVIDHFLGWCADNGVNPFLARRRDIDRYANHLAHHVGDVTLAKYLAAVSSFFAYAVQESESADHNPAADVKRPKVAHEAHRDSLDLDEAHALLNASRVKPRTAALVHLLLSTGIRVSEAVTADVGNLGWTPDHVRSLRVVRKGGKQTTIPIHPPYWSVIQTYLDGRGDLSPTAPLLASTRGRMSRQSAYRIVSELARDVVPHLTIGPHSLRHTAATLALNDGVAIQEVQGMLGHSDSRTTTRYDRDGGRRGGPAFERLGKLLATREAS